MKVLIISFYVILFCGLKTVFATSFKYVILSGKDTVGYLEISKRIATDSVFYEYKSDASITFFKKFHVVGTKKACFWQGKLIRSETKNVVNGNVRDYAKVNWEQGEYRVTQKDKKGSIQSEPVYFSSIKMFFEEPEKRKLVYYEAKNKFRSVKALDNNVYEVDGGFAHSTTFFYKEGKAVRIKVNIPIIKFELFLIETDFSANN